MRVFLISNPVAGKRFQQGLRLPDWITSDAQHVIHRETEYQGPENDLPSASISAHWIAMVNEGTLPTWLESDFLAGSRNSQEG
jgi:hypothetical protein